MTKKNIPYGLASYREVREKNRYYVDKTMYISELEQAGEYLFFIRPRRFGKSLLLSMLANYYDVATAEHFDRLFEGTYIHNHPTPEKNQYLILTFNFSKISPELDQVKQSFDEHVIGRLEAFGKKYQYLLGEDFFATIDGATIASQKVEYALDYVGTKGYRTYILIDEYDNFTNTIMANHGQAAYQDITHGAGFYRFFFNILKGAAGMDEGGLSRLFITGVSPVTMDDVTSGFNIGIHISLEPIFNEMLGFTEQDVRTMLEYYAIPTDEVLPLLQQWYNNYRFAIDARTYLFNTDMVLYFVRHYRRYAKPPEDMIDQNIKVDYGKLRHLLVLNRQLNGNFGYLQRLTETRTLRGSQIDVSFPMERLTHPNNFVSLLYYFGLLTYTEDNQNLMVPNQTVLQLLYGYLRDGLMDVNMFRVDMRHLIELLANMASDGEWQPVIDFLAREIEAQTSVRDFLKGEKVIQTFLVAYLNISQYYIAHSEYEMGKGFVDIYMEPSTITYLQIRYSYIIELKYLKRDEYNDTLVHNTLDAAKEQLQRYTQAPRTPMSNRTTQLKRIALVYAGWELVRMEEC